MRNIMFTNACDLLNRIEQDVDFFAPTFTDGWNAPRQIKELSANSFPPTNIYVKEDKSYVIESALAGITREELSIETQNQNVTLKVKKEAKAENTVLIQRGIKNITDLTTTFYIPKQYDIDKLNANYENGLLILEIPLTEREKRLSEKKTIEIGSNILV